MLDQITHIVAASLFVWRPEFVSILTLMICAAGILGLHRYFGLMGLISYQIMAVVVGNIQVLQITQFQLFSEPMALGNVLFSTTFLVSDIICAHFGRKEAHRAVLLSFWAQIWVTVFMVISLGHNPVIQTADTALLSFAEKNYAALSQIFTPSLRILTASLFAYMVSQYFVIHIIGVIRNLMGEKHAWLRQNVSMLLASFMDTFLFTWVAWIILSPAPVSMHTLMMTYIVPALLFRILISPLSTPITYLSYKIHARV